MAELQTHRASGLVDVLDRVLDKGLVIAGDVKISLAEVELLTIRIRLIVCSIDKAQAIGLDWWRQDSYFGSAAKRDGGSLKEQLDALEQKVAALSEGRTNNHGARRTNSKRPGSRRPGATGG